MALSLVHILILVLVAAGIIGVFLIVIRQAGITIPPWVISITWIVGVVLIGVIAIKFLASLL